MCYSWKRLFVVVFANMIEKKIVGSNSLLLHLVMIHRMWLFVFEIEPIFGIDWRIGGLLSSTKPMITLCCQPNVAVLFLAFKQNCEPTQKTKFLLLFFAENQFFFKWIGRMWFILKSHNDLKTTSNFLKSHANSRWTK